MDQKKRKKKFRPSIKHWSKFRGDIWTNIDHCKSTHTIRFNIKLQHKHISSNCHGFLSMHQTFVMPSYPSLKTIALMQLFAQYYYDLHSSQNWLIWYSHWIAFYFFLTMVNVEDKKFFTFYLTIFYWAEWCVLRQSKQYSIPLG